MRGRKSSGAKWIDRGCLTKKRYTTREKAQRAVAKAKSNYGEEKRLYHCPLCCGYHLFSPDKESY